MGQQKLPLPGIEPGFSEPQSEVLTTILQQQPWALPTNLIYIVSCGYGLQLLTHNIIESAMFKKSDMEYRKLGNTGLFVSALSYGNFNSRELIPLEEQVRIYKTCLQNGINTFDTAEIYSEGRDEQDLGKVLQEIKEPRENYVISTKIWSQPNPSINSTRGTSRKHVKESLKGSLKRLQLDYVDVVYAHSYDQETPIEEICRAFHDVIEEGLSFYWGTSNWDADKIYEAMQVCEKYNLHRPVVGENQYNMINRKEIQDQYRTLFENYKYGLAAYSPLLGGYLTGKYLDNKQAQGRMQSDKTGSCTKKQAQFRWYHDLDREKTDQILRQLKELAEKQLGCDLASLAIAWVIRFKYTSTAIMGARNVDQLERCLKAMEVYKKLTNEVEGRINKILGTHPTARTYWKTFTPEPHFRPLAQ